MNSVRPSKPAGRHRRWRPVLSVELLISLVCVYFLVACNGSFWSSLHGSALGIRSLAALAVALFALHAAFFGLLAWGKLAKPLLALALVVTATASWYMSRYAVVFDTEMVRNVLHTDVAESRELISLGMVLHVLLVGVLPALLVLLVRRKPTTLPRMLLLRLAFVVAMVALAAGGVVAGGQGMFSAIRSDPALRFRITPGNYIVGLYKAFAQDKKVANEPRQVIAADARRAPDAATRAPRVLVLVVGETVRGDHWGLNGYARQTTPQLAQRDVINFPKVQACGTSTEVSLPCMFSMFGRAQYDREAIRSHESLLDVAKRAGVQVLWRDNQSGCKGVCAGVEFVSMGPKQAPALCSGGRCMDEILLTGLKEKLDALNGDTLLVLHMLGNHGPNYFERYPPAFARWTPVCSTPELSKCSTQSVINAYDNAILYSDHVLAQLVDLLARSGRDSAMVFLSDHGESLGEYGLYLHGAPYAIAPQQQLHVPMTLWLSPSLVKDAHIDLACLHARAQQPASHDNLFPTVLGMFDIQTQVYAKAGDLLAHCRAP